MKVFFSYGHDDNQEIVNRIKDDLEARGHEVWIDKSKIKSGEDWRRSIYEGVNSSTMTMAFASNYALREPGVCRDELKIAVTVKCAFVQTVILEPNVNVPTIIGYRHYINMSDWASKKNDDDFEVWYQEKLEKIIKIIESDETQEYAKEVERLKEILKPDLSSAKKERLSEEYFCGRKWLSQKVNDWIKSDSKSNILMIDGSPGVGKSAFMANLFTLDPHVGAILFCEWDNPSFNNLDAISRNLIFQLATKHTDYRGMLVNFFKNADQTEINQILNDSFKTLLVKNVRTMVNGERPTVLILIDGIDELEDKTGAVRRQNVLAELLQREKTNFPNWLKFVVSSRCDTRVSFPLKNVDFIHIDDYKEENRADIKKYLDHELADKISGESYEKLLDKIDDNFLYARMVVKALSEDKVEIEEILEGENSDLASFYRQYLDRTFDDLEEFENIYYPIISSLAVVDEPIPRTTFANITGWSKREEKRYIKSLRPFLAINEDYMSFYHKSFKDWLLSDEADEYIVDYDFGLRSLASGIYKSYEYDKEGMSDFELKHLIDYLTATGDKRLKEVLADEDLAELMMKKANEKAKLFAYGDSTKLGKMAYKIYENNDKNEKASKAALFLGKISDHMCELDESSKWCERGLEKIQDEENPTDKDLAGEIRLVLANALFRKNNWKEAVDQYQKASLYFDNIANSAKKLEALILMANTYRTAKDFESALALLKQIEEEIKKTKFEKENQGLYITYLINYAWALQESSDNENSMDLVKKAKAFMEKSEENFPNNLTAHLYYVSSIVYYYQGQYEKAKIDCLKSLDLVKKAYGANAVEKVSAINQLGSIEQKLGNHDKAVETFKKGLDTRLNYYGLKNIYTSISIRNYAKAIERRRGEGDIDRAGKIFKEVEALRKDLLKEDLENYWLGQIYSDLSEHYAIIGEYPKAKEYALRAVSIFRVNGPERDLSNAILELAIADYHLGNIEESIKYFKECLDFAENSYNHGHPYLKVVTTYYQKALKELKK